MGSLGFESQGSVVGLVATRSHSDEFDSDLITVSIDDAGRVTVVADPFDTDLVTCLPR